MSDQSKGPSEPRTYRRLMKPAGLVSFEVVVGESDLHISALRDLAPEARHALVECRTTLETYIAAHPAFLTALTPLDVAPDAPELIQTMARAARAANVGPMAAVAGAVAEAVGRHLLPYSDEVIVENGGDLFLRTRVSRRTAIYAGPSPFSLRIGLDLPPAPDGLGVCTSAATTGHSLSFGRADAVVILAPDAAVADAWATAIGNLVKTKDDVQPALDHLSTAPDVLGGVVIIGDALGAWGQVTLTRLP